MTVFATQPATDLAQETHEPPCPDELGGAQARDMLGQRGLEIADLQERPGERDRLVEIVIVHRGQDVEKVVLELGHVLEHMALAGVEEVDHPHVAAGVHQDVRRVQVPVDERHVVVVAIGKALARQELVVEAADVRDLDVAPQLDGHRRRHPTPARPTLCRTLDAQRGENS